jgi:hypothetical protein
MTRVLVLLVLAFLILAACGVAESESPPETSNGPVPTAIGSSTSTQPATVTTETTKTAMTVAEEWIDAYEVGDVPAYQSLMSQSVTFHCRECGYDRAVTEYFAPVGGAELDARDSRLLALSDGSLNANCSIVPGGVTCETLRESDFGFFTSDGEPTNQDKSVYDFTVEESVITHLTVTRSGGNLFDFSHIQAYRLWLADQYPDAHEELFALTTILLATENQFEQHQTYMAEFLAAR